MSTLASELASVASHPGAKLSGRVAAVRGMTLVADDLPLPVGSTVVVRAGEGVHAEVIGFTREQTLLMPLASAAGVRAGDPVEAVEHAPTAAVGASCLGRVIDGLGRPLDGDRAPTLRDRRPLSPPPVGALERARVTKPIRTGVRALDLMLPMGRGQRLGLFAGPGVGKSTLLGQIARGTSADVNVIALIGERGREVREFCEDALGPEALAHSVVVVSTGDESPAMRLRAARLASAQAEYFRDQGLDVLLMMDSVTRFAQAQRQVGLAAGEPPATKGYTPSVFAEMARLLERAGSVESGGGSVTGLYTVLVEGDDMTEPVADAARGILDGHVILSRDLARRGWYPAIDVLDSVSRVADAVSDTAHTAARRQILSLLAAHKRVAELLEIGAYAPGSDPEADVAIALRGAIESLLRQTTEERASFDHDLELLMKIALQSGEQLQQIASAGGLR